MTPTTRLIVNTLAQNIRTVVNICLSLYSTRLVMNILGQSDYGIYMLVAGIVSFLSYFTTAMVTTTQRHLSYSHGQRDKEQTKLIFANSYLTNTLLGLSLVLILVSLTSFLFNGSTLNISADKFEEAKWVYLIILTSIFLTFITSPFKASLIARENVVYISVVDIIDGILKVALVFLLYLFESQRLVVYSCIITFVMLFNFLALAIYAVIKYEECCLLPKFSHWNKHIQKDLLGFTTWTIYGSLSIFFRTQGIAILLNRAFGTVINASFGIAGQILGSLAFLSSAILNAFTPQIIKAEGEKNREHMLVLCLKACKYCYLLLAIVALPVIFEIDNILSIWLGDIPDYAPLFCRIFLISAIVDQITTGLNVANQALGKIRNYTILIYTTKLLTVPAIWFAMKNGYNLTMVMITYLLFEILTAVIRLPYIARTTGLKTRLYIVQVLLPVIMPTLFATFVCYGMTFIPAFPLRFLITGIVSVLISIITIWFFAFDIQEKEFIKKKIVTRLHKNK